MAFAPDYATSRRFYIYTTNQAGSIEVDEVLRDADNPDHRRSEYAKTGHHHPAPAAVEPQRRPAPVRAGRDALHRAPGDGGGGGDPFRTGQNLSDRRGKILRIDPRESGDLAYTIPANNPFVNRDAAYGEIWSYGVRNPWRFSFDRLTGAFVLGDVGQNVWEEIDCAADRRGVGARGQLRLELHGGPAPLRQLCPSRRITRRRSSSTRTAAARCSITGGYIVRDPNIASMAGRYIYVDYLRRR